MVGPSPGYLTLQGIVILHAENVNSAEMAAAISTLGDRLASLWYRFGDSGMSRIHLLQCWAMFKVVILFVGCSKYAASLVGV